MKDQEADQARQRHRRQALNTLRYWHDGVSPTGFESRFSGPRNARDQGSQEVAYIQLSNDVRNNRFPLYYQV